MEQVVKPRRATEEISNVVCTPVGQWTGARKSNKVLRSKLQITNTYNYAPLLQLCSQSHPFTCEL